MTLMTVRVGGHGPRLLPGTEIGPLTVAQHVMRDALEWTTSRHPHSTEDTGDIAAIDAVAAGRGGARGDDAPHRWTFSDGSCIATVDDEEQEI